MQDMAPPRVSLKAFLSTAKTALSAPPAQRPNPLTFVVGNESADLDSLCSAVLLAYFRTHTPPHTLHIPLSNLPRADLTLRPELTAVLRPAGLKPDDLVTLSDLPSDGLNPENTRWFLVDHNAPTSGLADELLLAGTTVIGCVDHHDDEGKVPHDNTNGEPRIIEKSGSCMSLVVDHCKEAWEKLSADHATEENINQQHDAELARLALGPILMDTRNLTSKDKTTDWDVQAAAFAEGKLANADKGYDRTAFFDEITRLKEGISGMSYRDLFRKDYKQWTDTDSNDSDGGRLTLGVSAIVQGFDYLLSETGDTTQLVAELKKWAREQRLDIAAVMTVSRPEDVFTRELLVWAFGERAVRVAKRFASENGERLGLESWAGGALDQVDDDDEGEWRVCWTQRRVENSRKQVAPLLREAMKGSSKL
ncbi:hypothetical protein B0T19DRAFT_426967 [Cercophora scortea]|uniref:DHHA2 domain-containing protein n=1 Tax=Cercophora scortea TaxID=314031 RepID=A0AAE0IEX6_9PEZI|nr:hypothetical protein B0T19DRAFT_426967 [Cercophora scortea]